MPPKSKPKKGESTPLKQVKAGSTAIEPSKQQTRPNWPAFGSLLPAEDLSLVSLLDDQIITVSQLWTTSLCKTYVNFLSSLPLTTTPGKPKRGEATRVNDRFQIEDPDFAERLWNDTSLKTLVENATVDGRPLTEAQRKELWGGEVLGLNSNIRVYRYSKGQYFDQHYDESNNVMFPSPSSPTTVPARTTWTLLLYLSSPATGCKGGETVFYPEPLSRKAALPLPVVAELEVGMALLHRHGKDCLLHEGREVTEGEKWIIRSDLCVKR